MSKNTKINILKNTLGEYYRSNSEYLFYCPRCEHHKRKLSINIEKNMFKCWVCDWSGRNIYRIIRRYGSFQDRNEWKRFFDQIEIENFAEKLFGKEEVEKDPTLQLPEGFVSLVNKNLPPTSQYPLNYLQSRNVTKTDIIKWKMGYCFDGQYGGRIILPSFDLDGKINYFIARSYSPNTWKKYMNPPVSKNIIFNHLYLDFDEDLILVEGLFDAIVSGPNAVPLLGSTLREGHKLFQEIVNNDSPIYIALDTDATKKELEIIKLLLKYDIEIYKIDISPYKDVGEMPKSVFLEKKQEAAFINSTDYLLRTIGEIK